MSSHKRPTGAEGGGGGGTGEKESDNLGVWVQMLEGAGFDLAGVDVGIDVGLLESNDSPESVGSELTHVDESIQGAGGDAEPSSCFFRGQPRDLVRTHAGNCSRFAHLCSIS